MLARVGGSEFAIRTLAVDPAEITGVARRAHHALEGCSRSAATASSFREVSASPSARAATPPATSLLRDACLAVHRARQQGGASHVLFDPKMHEQAATAQQIETELRAALAGYELRRQKELIDDVASTLRDTGIDTRSLRLQITEGR